MVQSLVVSLVLVLLLCKMHRIGRMSRRLTV
nr:MAG TPA: hypothetical protein [Microviridae sp.]